jgi:hypothetical protein
MRKATVSVLPVHREPRRVKVLGDVVAIELSIWGTFLGPFETPAGVIQPTGAQLDIPTADFWYVRNGKIQEYDCHIGTTTMFALHGVSVGIRGRYPSWSRRRVR